MAHVTSATIEEPGLSSAAQAELERLQADPPECPLCGETLVFDSHDGSHAYFKCPFVEHLRAHWETLDEGDRGRFVSFPLLPEK